MDPQGARPRVLVVDDKEYVRELMRTTLEAAGYDVVAAADGREGLAAARRDRPDLILLDLILPGLDGRQVLAALRSERELAAVPVIVMSALGDAAELGECQEAAATLVKPFTLEDLLDQVERLVPKARERGPGDAVGIPGQEGDEGERAGAAPRRPSPGLGAQVPAAGEG